MPPDWYGAAGGAAAGGLQAFGNYQAEKQARKDYRQARERAFGVMQGLEADPALGAARQSIMGDLNQPQGIDPGTQRQMMSTLRGNVAGQAAGQVRGLNEDMARRGLLGGSAEQANRQAISRQALASMAGGQAQLSIESQQEKSRKEALARNQALSLMGARQGNVGAASGILGAQTGGLAALLGKFQRPGDVAKAAKGGAELFGGM